MTRWVLLLFLFPGISHAQRDTLCEPGSARANLEVGQTRALISNHGGLFRQGNQHVYETPKDEGTHTIFATNLWIGGMVHNELRIAASRYGPQEFAPGPVYSGAGELGPDQQDCSAYDQIWEITREDIDRFVTNGHVSDNMLQWPWHLGAPVIDGDGQPGNYNLAGGDLPELLGDQRLWWIMNDVHIQHKSTGSAPLGIEVHASAFAKVHTGGIGNETFYTYRLINKHDTLISDTYLGLFIDVDIGASVLDDLVGTDSLLHLGYGYNGSNEDDGPGGYGKAPPAIGFSLLQSAPAVNDGQDNDYDGQIDNPGEMLGLTGTFIQEPSCDVCSNEYPPENYYLAMQSRWPDGSPLTFGGHGRYLSDKPARFLFPGNPETQEGWSEVNTMVPWLPLPIARDARLIMASGPFDLAPADTVNFTLAAIWARGENNFNAVSRLKTETALVRQATEALLTPYTGPVQPHTGLALPNRVLGFDQNFPNPFSQATTLRYSLPQTMQVRLAVYDLLGREVALLVDAQQEAGIHTVKFDAGNLPAGVYLARIELDFLRFTKRMVLLK